jgi:hypothetical protein
VSNIAYFLIHEGSCDSDFAQRELEYPEFLEWSRYVEDWGVNRDFGMGVTTLEGVVNGHPHGEGALIEMRVQYLPTKEEELCEVVG